MVEKLKVADIDARLCALFSSQLRGSTRSVAAAATAAAAPLSVTTLAATLNSAETVTLRHHTQTA